MGKSSNPPITPTRIPRPSTPPGGTSPTRSNPRRGIGLLQAAGRGDIFRSGSRSSVIGQIGVWPLSITVNESHGYSVGPMRPAAHQSGIPPPVNVAYQQHTSRPASSRGPSASNTTGSPESQLNYGYASATTSVSPEGAPGIRHVPMTGDTTTVVSSATTAVETQGGVNTGAPPVHPPRVPGSSLPVRLPQLRPPPTPEDIAYIPADAWTSHELKLPKVAPANSDDSLGSKHRDSLALASVQSIPRLTPPGAKKGKFSDFFAKENPDSPQSDSPKVSEGQKARTVSTGNSQVTRDSSVFEDWPVPVEVQKGSPELEYVEDVAEEESPGAAQNKDSEQKEVVESQDDVKHQENLAELEGDGPHPGTKVELGPESDRGKEVAETDESSMLTTLGMDALVDDTFKFVLAQDSATRDARRTGWVGLPPVSDPKNPQSGEGSGSVTKPLDLRSQLPVPTQKASGEKGGGIPKSRTRNALNHITTSLSRASLSSFRIHSRRHTPSAMTSPNEDESPARTMHSSGENLISAQQATTAHHLDSVRLIYDARDTEWWAGRFLALEDRFREENLRPENMAAIIASSTKIPGPVGRSHNPAGLPSSSTMACFPSSSTAPTAHDSGARERAALLTDEDTRTRRVFSHLKALCMTDAARKSLYAFQQQYARNQGKESLLPPGGTMVDEPRSKGLRWVGRIFSGKDKDKKF
ncbi:uncharacterized protein GGS22DRAFT_96165 [Annulohypoxylon maeteangense]|uniref:uncharacterized protein n=1 Tax=Annulohypoxylon maeteangense TaxID=1927788 RepID=UPI002007E82D|nr:uncharacterized protein GGS22DRAFT_96165 [Annulohypoxylon maeteangense]KAI0888339.1 hypothetical protein GGS22DRAFT_96165 [Annulohypoxylon maeteangense]